MNEELYRLFLEDFDIIFAEFFKDEIVNKMSKSDKNKLRVLFFKSYRVADVFKIMFPYLSKEKRIEIYNIRQSKLMIFNEYPALLVKDDEIVYRFVKGKNLKKEECEMVESTFPHCIFYLGNELCLFNFVGNKLEVTPGIYKEGQNLNISTSNGKDWIKHYLSNKVKGHLYFITFKYQNSIGFKIGISKNFESRLANLKKHLDIISYELEFGDMLENSIKERAYHEYLKSKRKFISESFEGSNECYYLIDKKLSIDEALDVLEESNYGLSKELLKFAIKERNEQ